MNNIEEDYDDSLLDITEEDLALEDMALAGHNHDAEINISGRCDICGRFCSTHKGAAYYHGSSDSIYGPGDPAELYCPKCKDVK